MAAAAADPTAVALNPIEIIALQFQPKFLDLDKKINNPQYDPKLDYEVLIKENTDGILFIYQSSIESFLNGNYMAEGGTAVVQPGRIELDPPNPAVQYKSAGILTGTYLSIYTDLIHQQLQAINYSVYNNTTKLTKTPYNNPRITPTLALIDGLKNIYIYAINPANNIRKIYYSADLKNPRHLGLGIFSDFTTHPWTTRNINIIQTEFQRLIAEIINKRGGNLVVHKSNKPNLDPSDGKEEVASPSAPPPPSTLPLPAAAAGPSSNEHTHQLKLVTKSQNTNATANTASSASAASSASNPNNYSVRTLASASSLDDLKHTANNSIILNQIKDDNFAVYVDTEKKTSRILTKDDVRTEKFNGASNAAADAAVLATETERAALEAQPKAAAEEVNAAAAAAAADAPGARKAETGTAAAAEGGKRQTHHKKYKLRKIKTRRHKITSRKH